MSIRQHSPSCTMILLILRSSCTQPSLSGTRSRTRCRYRLSSSLTPVMFACAAAFLRDETLFRVATPCGFFYSLRKPFLPACMKTAVVMTAASLFRVIKLLSRILDVCLRKSFQKQSISNITVCNRKSPVFGIYIIARLYAIFFCVFPAPFFRIFSEFLANPD